MLEIRPSCEHCGRGLPNESEEAMICTFECTFCADCVSNLLQNVCPNCGGGFEKRPTRPKAGLRKYASQTEPTFKPIDLPSFQPLRERNKGIPPRER